MTAKAYIMDGLSVLQIDALTAAGLYTELCRLLATEGGNVEVKEPSLIDFRLTHEYTIFTTATQHVTGPTMEIAIKKALVMERFRQEAKRHGVLWSSTDYCTWVNQNSVPVHLRL